MHYADDGTHGVAEPQRPMTSCCAGEAPLPDVVTDEDEGAAPGRKVGISYDPADARRHPRQPERG